MTRFLVTGASGLLGLNFALRYCQENEVIGQVNQHGLTGVPFRVIQSDLSQADAAGRLLEQTHPDVVVHCAALANLEACEADPRLAQKINTIVPGELAALCARQNIRMVHLSTDAVFDGQQGNYLETDSPNPLSVYARTKLEGEQAVARANPDAIIARVNFYGWSLGGTRSLAEFFVNHLSAGKPVRGFTDVFFCPLEAGELAELLVLMVRSGLSGLFHSVSRECLSKFEFGKAIADCFGFDGSLVQPSSWKDAGLVAARSPDLTLNTGKLSSALGIALPGQEAGLKRFYQLYQEGFPNRIREMAQYHDGPERK